MVRHLDSLASQRDSLCAPGWRVLSIGEVLENSKYGCNSPAVLDGNSPVVGMKNLAEGRVNLSSLTRVNLSDKEREEYALRRGDILINRTNSYELVGKAGIFESDDYAAFVSYLVRLRGKRSVIDQAFLNFWLNTETAQRIIKRIATRAISQANLNPTEFKKHCPVPVPTLPEQRAIASVLQCWDKGVRQLEAKIAAKERVKKGLMQQLLSGQLRLSGFGETGSWVDGEWQMPEDWSKQRVGDVFSYVKSHAFSREQLTDESASEPYIYNIHYGDLHARYPGPLLDFEAERRVPVLKDGASAGGLAYLQSGDLVMADVSEDFEGVGACVELVHLNGREVTAGLHTFVLRDTAGATVNGFRGYLFKEHALAKELRRIATGFSVYGISKTNLAKVIIALPSLKEQKAIVRVLSAADREIDALRRKLEAWKTQKKYLLNNLVDGSIRLPEFAGTGKEGGG